MSNRLKLNKSVQDTVVKNAHLLDPKIDPHLLMAILDVETNGKCFNPDGTIPILIEGHKFHDFLPVEYRIEAVNLGYAIPKWEGKSYYNKFQKTQADAYKFLEKLNKYCSTRGLAAGIPHQSMSMGIGQLMGFHYQSLGYNNAVDMFLDASSSEKAQLSQFFEYLRINNFVDALVNENFKQIARKYNGSAYAKHNYHGRIEAAYRKYLKSDKKSPSKNQQVNVKIEYYQVGTPFRTDIKEIQQQLLDLGYTSIGIADGLFGESTRAAVINYQSNAGLNVDGVIGPETLRSLRNNPVKNKVSNERQQLTTKDLRKHKDEEVKKIDGNLATAGSIGGIGAVAAAANTFLENDSLVMRVMDLVENNFWIILLVLGVGFGVATIFRYRRHLARVRAGKITQL